MVENLYEFTGPLDPDRHQIICAPRRKELNEVIEGVKRGDYWSILGPRQIGKTTFLYQLCKALSREPYACIYIDLEIGANSEETFYEILINEIMEKLPKDIAPMDMDKWKKLGGEYYFYKFLKHLHTPEHQKMVFLLDEIGRVPCISSFLKLWRKVSNERIYDRELRKYSIIIAGAEDIISLTMDRTSPFNISKKMFLTNLAKEEASQLIHMPMEAMGLDFSREVEREIMTRTSAHPQLLQHLCYLLVDNLAEGTAAITTADVEQAVARLFKNNDNLETLENQLKRDENLRNLVIRLLRGEKVKYLSYHKYAATGAGPVVERVETGSDGEEKYCTFRSPLYREYLEKIIDLDEYPLEPMKESTFLTTLYCDEDPAELVASGKEEQFLFSLFNKGVRIIIHRDNVPQNNLDLSEREKLFFCYLAYKNYKAFSEGYETLEDIPPSYKYQVSSRHENNELQTPEWGIFKQALKRIDVEHIGDGIKAWALSIRRKLDRVNARDLIDSGSSGRGSGYLLRGRVLFLKGDSTANLRD